MSFAEQLTKTLDNTYNRSVTENGAVGYRTTSHALLDMNFKVASYRSRPDEAIINDFLKAYKENMILAMRWLFYARDAREGLGERRFFRVVMRYLADNHTDTVNRLIPLIAEYGRWDDLLVLLHTKAENKVIAVISEQLKSDMVAVTEGKSASLLAKWLPSEGASSQKTRSEARYLMTKLGLTNAKYRKMISKIRAYLKVVEIDMSKKNWEGIDYEAVPSKANLLYNSAFLRHDEMRRRAFLGAVEKGEAKINSSVNFPHDIVHKYCTGTWGSPNRVDAGLEALWKALPNVVDGDESTLVVADGSGSMTCRVGGTNLSALEVANALAVYFAERASGEFKNKYITFSSHPQLVNLYGDTLCKNLQIARQHNEVANTNIEATFDLILKTAIDGRMTQAEMPKNILIISDMEFDSATYGRWNRPSATLFDTIAKKYAQHGYVLPRLVFWNVNSRTETIPVKQNDMGVALVSGFSVNIVKMVMDNELDPYKLLVKAISVERYDAIQKALEA